MTKPPNICWHCECKNPKGITRGHFLCKECEAAYFEYLRLKSKGDKSWMTLRDKILKLSNEGLKPKQIAQKLDISTATVYNYRYQLGISGKRQVKELVERKMVEKDSITKNEGKATVTKKPTKDYKSEYETLKKAYDQDKEKYNQSYQDLFKRHKDLIEENRNLVLENEQLQKELKTAQIKPAPMNDIYRNAFEKEKRKHDVLLEYVILLNGGVVKQGRLRSEGN